MPLLPGADFVPAPGEVMILCARTIAEHEQRLPPTCAKNVHGAIAQVIGRGCIALAESRDEDADTLFEAAHLAATEAPTGDDTDEFWNICHAALAHGLHERTNPQAVDQSKQAIHQAVITRLVRRQSEYNRFWQSRNGYIGYICEDTGTALLTRLPYPWIFAVPSLVHQEGSSLTTHNHDTSLVLTGLNRTQPTQGLLLQMKNTCVGVCSDPLSGSHRIDRSDYEPFITFVSGHCDLRISGPDKTGYQQAPLTNLLSAELQGTATAKQLRTLDFLSNMLLNNLLKQHELRRGTKGKPSTKSCRQSRARQRTGAAPAAV